MCYISKGEIRKEFATVESRKIERGVRMLLALHIGLGLMGIALLLVNAWEHPLKDLLFSCPTSFFHLYCPGCGGTRAISELLRLNILSSVRYNPNPLVWACALFYIDLRSVWILKRKGTLERPYFSRTLFTVIVSVYFLNFILRNLLLVLWDVDFIGDHAEFWAHSAPFATGVAYIAGIL